MTTSIDSIIEKLKTRGGRGFTLAVLKAFEYLGFEVEDIEETEGTQAHSDLIVKASRATNPYFAVLECTAVRERSEVGYQKLYQLGSNFPRYVTKYGKQYPSASFKILVGRPSFSSDTKKLATDITLMTTEILIKLLSYHEEIYLSQDEFEKLFQHKGLITETEVNQLVYPYWRKASIYAWIYQSLLRDPKDGSLKRKRKWTNIERVVGMVKQWGMLLANVELPDDMIVDAIRDLSSPVLRVLLINGQNVIISSLPFDKIVQNMGALGKAFKRFLMESIGNASKL